MDGAALRLFDVSQGMAKRPIVGTDLFAIGFTTEEGPPVEIAMPRDVAEKTIRSILDDLKGGRPAKQN